ncbi:MAG: hypothetical protein ACRD2L_12180 [Terriglobia bacterium]
MKRQLITTRAFSNMRHGVVGNSEAVPREDDSTPKNLSPYEIRNFINAHPRGNLTKLWRQLGTKTINDSESPRPDYAEFRFLGHCENCEAELFEYDLDGDPGNEAVLKVSDEVSQVCRFLIFGSIDQREDQWRLLGHIDHDLNKYRMAQHIVFLDGGRSWLVVRGQGASGTGVASYFDRVFLVGRGGVRQVLSYMSEGHQGGFSYEPTREFFGQLVSLKVRGGVVSAEIRFTVQYWGEDRATAGEGMLLFAKLQTALFTGQVGTGKQVIDPNRSDLTQRELDDVYNIDSLTDEGFLQYNDAELSAIAKGRDSTRKEWLRRFLDECEGSARQRRLRHLLGH